MTIKDNSRLYARGPSDWERGDLQYQAFPARVLTVDWERKVCTLEDLRTGNPYTEVNIFPANASAFESSDVNMPEAGSTCVAIPVWWRGGYTQIAIVSWQFADASRAEDAIAVRPVEGVEGYSNRRRGSYRKAYPGQKTVATTTGYTEKIDSDWDYSGKDLSRDHLDSDRRTWTEISGRRVEYSDAGISFRGSVNRPNAQNIVPSTLPDGTQQYVLFLEPGASEQDRYVNGKQDVIPFSENTQRIQEYALDYTLPQEILETDLFDFVLGTTQDPWQRTQIVTTGNNVSYDDESYAINQDWDHPYTRGAQTVGPTTKEGPTPRRRGFILEKSEGTLVGYNRFDKLTYGQVLKPILFPYTTEGRFGADVESGYLPVVDSVDHAEARLAASAQAIRFPQEYNSVRWDITKEGSLYFEIGATLPKENIPLQGGYEHPHGAGRSMEGHLVGSLKLVVGKNRDEEDAIDLQALGQSVLRLGADDASLPNERRTLQTQIRGQKDALGNRTLQYWTSPKLKPNQDSGNYGDPTSSVLKTGAENVSLRMSADGAVIARFGARTPGALRRHLINGYRDGQGKQLYSQNRIDSKSPGRPFYPAGESNYSFHDLTQAGHPQLNFPPFNTAAWDALGTPVPGDSNQTNSAMDQHGLSLELHTVRDMLVRVGGNPTSGQSILIDTDGGLVATLGADKQGRSITASLDGGAVITIQPNKIGKALQIELVGDIDVVHKGNLHWQTTGDWITECTTWRHVTKTDRIFTDQKSIEASLVRHTTEAPDIVHNQGLYQSDENS
jgi:hypothetical protein